MARTQATVLTRSWQVPQATAVVLVDASALVKRRETEGEAIRERYGVKPTYTDFILEAVVRSIEEVPLANATFKDDALILYEDINISIATATELGLMAPVLHQAQQLSLGERALRLREIAQRAREGKLTPQDIEGGTITVSNLGTSGVEMGTPLVTEPQAVTIFAGTILNRPVAIGNTVEVRPTFYLDMAYDHRVLDGATTAKFITTVKRYLEAS
jgi:pyruvate/2-oxoglutarate dehydrogenase complex dihydrolipoamide acyltransferase (E2) component